MFASNSINILAGVNGLEAGQTFIIAAAVLLHNLTQIAGFAGKDPAVRDGHLFSAYLMLPLATTTLGLLRFNWFPSQVFVKPYNSPPASPNRSYRRSCGIKNM